MYTTFCWFHLFNAKPCVYHEETIFFKNQRQFFILSKINAIGLLGKHYPLHVFENNTIAQTSYTALKKL